eukprot:CAMPEP_0197572254 /NCGR_PEP_ID=MMETSP1320-20131121/42366_1 /TAXON_ID=91990 /ORGANISM="Bolidomonas sp., Strain RCC2347" /LENGTH=448 /DNA_ID=CAMNT_0043134759 /DNA_START=140 /DNA_END=1484 /DNA_ORIENTATION=+
MSSFVPSQGSGVPFPAPNGPSSGHMSEKPPPVPWQQLTSMFETTSTSKPSVPSVPLIVANKTLEQDKETVLRCWLAMGGKEDTLRRKYYNDDYIGEDIYAYDWHDEYGDDEEYLMRDKPSDVVSEWYRVTVEGGRVTGLQWDEQGLTGTIPAEIGALSALIGLDLSHNKLNGAIPPTIGALSSLTHLGLNINYLLATGTIPAEIGALSALTGLDLSHNKLNGAIPPTIGALSSLTELNLHSNSLSGDVPYSFSSLPNLEHLGLNGNNFSNQSDCDLYSNLYGKRPVQDYLISLWLPQTLRLLNYGIAITKKRQDSLSTATTTSITLHPPPPHPFFAFLADHEDSLTDLIMSFLDPWYCCNKDRTALLKCWRSLGGVEDELKMGYGDDVGRWKGVKAIEGGRVVEIRWCRLGLKGTLPSEIGELDGLRKLDLEENEISSIPSEIGKLTS